MRLLGLLWLLGSSLAVCTSGGLVPYPFDRVSGVLVNSAGGEGTTFTLKVLKTLKFPTNDPNDIDTFKHKSARACKDAGFLRQSAGHAILALQKRGSTQTLEANRVIYLTGDPLHSMMSVFRRWPVGHMHRTKLGCPTCSKSPLIWSKGSHAEQLQALFSETTRLGYDAYGWQFHFDTWVGAQRSTGELWPPIYIVDLHNLMENPCILAHFLNVTETSLLSSGQFKYLPQPRHYMEEASPYLSDTARRVYANLSAVVESVITENVNYYAALFGCTPKHATEGSTE
jgi:hypothetical protein